jgi:hypothetical protein
LERQLTWAEVIQDTRYADAAKDTLKTLGDAFGLPAKTTPDPDLWRFDRERGGTLRVMFTPEGRWPSCPFPSYLYVWITYEEFSLYYRGPSSYRTMVSGTFQLFNHCDLDFDHAPWDEASSRKAFLRWASGSKTALDKSKDKSIRLTCKVQASHGRGTKSIVVADRSLKDGLTVQIRFDSPYDMAIREPGGEWKSFAYLEGELVSKALRDGRLKVLRRDYVNRPPVSMVRWRISKGLGWFDVLGQNQFRDLRFILRTLYPYEWIPCGEGVFRVADLPKRGDRPSCWTIWPAEVSLDITEGMSLKVSEAKNGEWWCHLYASSPLAGPKLLSLDEIPDWVREINAWWLANGEPTKKVAPKQDAVTISIPMETLRQALMEA